MNTCHYGKQSLVESLGYNTAKLTWKIHITHNATFRSQVVKHGEYTSVLNRILSAFTLASMRICSVPSLEMVRNEARTLHAFSERHICDVAEVA